MALWHIVYVSSAASGVMSRLDLKDLIEKAAANNVLNNITGMLLYFAGTFMQVIEGEECDLRKVFSRIERDPRHKGIIVLLNERIERRTFSGFSMDCKELHVEDFPTAQGCSGFLRDGFSSPHLVENPSIAFELVKTFRDNCKKFSIF